MTKLNTEYERLVANILQGMLKHDGFEALRVEHDVTLVGKSGATHQIDVFWEFKAAGTIYRTCVECKNYTSAVKKSHVAAFAAILADIGNANGIIATTRSFQKGATLLAEQNNIRLVLVNNLLQAVHITMRPRAVNYSRVTLNFNQTSVKEALTRNDLDTLTLDLRFSGEQPLLNENAEKEATFNTLLNKHSKTEGHNRIENVSLYLDVEELGLILLDSIDFHVSYTDLQEVKSIIQSPNSAMAVIEEIVDNNKFYLHDDGIVNQMINNVKN